jgi:hypothetical protein
MKVAVIIPSYCVKKHILDVVNSIPDTITNIYIIDDKCPENTGNYVFQHCQDTRIKVIFNEFNLGVGGAVMSGYHEAIKDEMDILVKLDGDGQMNPELIHHFITPIINGAADYTKGNRFYDLTYVLRMPKIRLIGNLCLSFMNKLSSGYWTTFDPTNGYTAIHSKIAKKLPFDKISNRYFFETDILFRLNILRANVLDIPMDAVYGDEKSNLKVSKILFEFFLKHSRNFIKRIIYNYFLRDFSLASLELVSGLLFTIWGFSFGLYSWIKYASANTPTPTGTIMLSVLPLLIGIQLLLNFFSYDINNIPKQTQYKLM